MLITFSAVDCAGKSTQIELLRQNLISRGKSCTVFWYRPGYSAELQKCKSLVRRLFAHSHKPANSGNTQTIRNVPQGHLARLWLITALVDSFLQWGAKLRLLMARYDVVLCDRYYWDGMLDLLFRYPDELWSESILSLIAGAFPKPDCALLLWIPQDIVQSRIAQKAEPFPDPDDIRELRGKIYDILRSRKSFTVIDASGDVDSIHREIVKTVDSLSRA